MEIKYHTMMFKTHLMFGILLGLLFITNFDIPYQILFMLSVSFFAILPDIDFHKSKIGQKIKPISWLINFLIGHRALFHSLLIALFFYFTMFLFFGGIFGAAALLGYFSHLFLDGFNTMGIRPLYPFKPQISGIIRSNGVLDYLLFFIFLGGSLYLII